jgi:hypothetical protein
MNGLIPSSPLARYSITTPATATPFPAVATIPATVAIPAAATIPVAPAIPVAAAVSGELLGNKKTAKRKRKLPPSLHYLIREAD